MRILSYNVWCHHLTPCPNKAERLSLLLAKLETEEYDLVMVQELFLLRVLPVSFCLVCLLPPLA